MIGEQSRAESQESRGSRVERRRSRARSSDAPCSLLRAARAGHPQPRAPRPQPPRNGVLILVVLSMLVLFMLIGTAYLMSSSQTRTQSKDAAKHDQHGNYATKLLDRAFLQVLRDTDNPYSVVRYHSLLRDLYGTDGFQGVVYAPADPVARSGPSNSLRRRQPVTPRLS